MLTLLNAGELLGPHFHAALEHGNVEVLAVVVARPVVITVGPVASNVDFEVTTVFAVLVHQQTHLKVGLHAEAHVDVDDAVVFLFPVFTFGGRIGVVGVEVGPGIGEAVVEEVHRGVVGVGLARVFLLLLLNRNVTGLDRNEQHGHEHERNQRGATHGKSTKRLPFEAFFILQDLGQP